MNLAEYVMAHVEHGACQCGRCADAPDAPETRQPSGHTADVVFFKVRATNGANAETLRALIREHRGDYDDVAPLDGKEHSYLELGAWIGDQGLALMLMGLGHLLGVWKLLTPYTVLGADAPSGLVQQMAGQGYVAVQAEVAP